jgi:HAD superfamily hydrolase (TIGR01490 family)
MEAAFFDLDKTVIAKASMVAFSRPFYKEGMLSRTLVLRALWGQLVYMHLGASEEKLARMRESVLALTKGWDKARISAIVADALEAVVDPIIYSEALELIEKHKTEGRAVFILSASPEEIVQPLGRYLGIDRDRIIASRACVDDDGRYTGEMELYAYGPEKADIMRRLAGTLDIDLSASYAYSDSATDIPMLEVVGHPVAVNPDRELARLAKEHGWDVRTFARPVRLRDRVPVPPAKHTAIGAASLAAVGGTAVLWWRLRAVSRRAVSEPQPDRARQGWQAVRASSLLRR